MKKKNKKSRIDDLVIDVAEYAFTEWLVRQGVFAAFKENYEFSNAVRGNFRNQLRYHIRVALNFPELGLIRLISSSFPFASTPEGADFWQKQSDSWKRFCVKFHI